MCGIAGLVGEFEPTAGRRFVQSLNASLALRGPDAEGLEAWPGAVLGHRRLSIFDLSALGNQPMLSPDREIGVVFNGAIYNFAELRRELEAAGYAFRSRSDTEVLVHGYRHWGIERMLPKLRGMFAVGIWDASQRKLTLFRDRMGVKPLLYTVRDNTLAFASTARALYDGNAHLAVDVHAVAEFLEHGYVTDDRSIFLDVHKVPAGGVVEWHDGRLRSYSYWSLPSTPTNTTISFEDAVEETERLLLDAVRLRLEADVKVGALLSGGVDSSLVCWAIRQLGGDVTAFTIGTPNDPLDESADAVTTARELGIPHEVIAVAADDTPDANDIAEAYGEPFAVSSALGMLRVSKAVKRSATVLLTGDGGDDVFLGYPEHKVFWMAERLARVLPAASRPAWQALRGVLPERGTLGRGKHFLDYATGGLGAITAVHDGLPFYWTHDLLGARLRDVGVSHRTITWSHRSATRLLSEFLAYDRRTRFTGEYMTKVDGGAMRYAVEARSPFLDHVLWEFAATLPYALRLRNGSLKAVLRELARRRIGDRVADGAKKGFGIPVGRWMAGRWGAQFEAVMQDSVLAREGLIDAGRVMQTRRQFAARGFVPNQLWYLFVLESWFRRLDRVSLADRHVAHAHGSAA